VDAAAGFSRLVKVGERVEAGDVLGLVHAADAARAAEARTALEAAVGLGDEAPPAPPLVIERVG
jgi:thymidine phosphorylase